MLWIPATVFTQLLRLEATATLVLSLYAIPKPRTVPVELANESASIPSRWSMLTNTFASARMEMANFEMVDMET